HRTNEVIAIYPITPSSPMGEHADEWAVQGRRNIWGTVPSVTEMQSEGGAAGAIHGALQGGGLATTFTSSQGLLLMIPNLYKIAGELTGYCMHVAARTVATHALSIFGDHSDVMACRQTGMALLASGSVQEAHDMALVGQAAALEGRVPCLHFFDGFRTSHEVAKIAPLSDDDLRAVISEEAVLAHRARALDPDRPVLRGSAQNPDTFFQAREACSPYYAAFPEVVERVMARFAERTGRSYHPFDYTGHPEAERVVVVMGSGAETVRETVAHLAAAGERVGAVTVRLYRPWSGERLLAALPASTRAVAVLDRTKEPGSSGEPLYLDVVASVAEAEQEGRLPLGQRPRVVGGRYGLSSKEFTPGMVKGILEELAQEAPRNHFTVGIVDDVSHTSLPWDEGFDIEPEETVRAIFYGLGSDGTVGANKNTIKIIGEGTDLYAQGYFVYDSKKSGAVTISHLRFGPKPIRAPYLIRTASFVACHQFPFLDKYDVLAAAAPGATFLLNAPYPPEAVWDHLPREVQEEILEKRLRFYAIDAYSVAERVGMGRRINTLMQTCFFALSGVLPKEAAIAKIKEAIEKTYGKKGEEVVRRNFEAVDAALDHLHEIPLPDRATAERRRPPVVPEEAPELVRKVTAVMMAGLGDRLPVSAFPPDGTWPTGTSQWEKLGVALAIPVWEPELCTECDKCAFVCPHAAIRTKAYPEEALAGAPEDFLHWKFKGKPFSGWRFTVQVAPDDCTGCRLCVEVCPAKDKANPSRKAINMTDRLEVLERERARYRFFLELPEVDATQLTKFDVKQTQLLQPLFEYSGACPGCGETPYIKLITQLYGDRMVIANATGCSSIYGGNLPTTPYTKNRDGRGPAWSNSLFEDNAEFGLGIRLGIDALRREAEGLLRQLAGEIGATLVDELLAADQSEAAGVAAQRERVAALRGRLAGLDDPRARRLAEVADALVDRSVWIFGGDGWAFDIGYGGLDHVLSLEHDVNILVMDTEVYSNTGGQASKATPLGAAAKFQTAGKGVAKKDLGLMAMSYGHVYVASIAFGAKDAHTVKAIREAESYPGPSLLLAYSHCIAHGYDLAYGTQQQKRAVDSGVWPLYRFDPRRVAAGEPPLVLDAEGGKIPVAEFMRNETRFRMVERIDRDRFQRLARLAQEAAERRIRVYHHLANLQLEGAAAS
ncbi:MAG: pyruvate:ferredoxin (flavodoxin) oxidoreductase, partial [Nitrospirae bacterium]